LISKSGQISLISLLSNSPYAQPPLAPPG